MFSLCAAGAGSFLKSLDPWVTAGLGLHAIWWEHWRYAPGAVEPLPVHSHAEYQISLMGAFPGEYFYRRSAGLNEKSGFLAWAMEQ